MFTQEKLETIKEYLANTPGKVYLGCDSQKYKKGNTWFARYTVVVIVHIENAHGGKVFYASTVERDYDHQKDRPRMRLMNEVRYVAEVYLLLAEELEEREVEIHLDINPNEKFGSNVVMKEAMGYVMGMTGIEAKIKPDAFAASYCADAGVRGRFD